MLELLADPNAWASLATLTILEIVLGIDNLIFISIVSARLPEAQQATARRIGLGLALVGRIALLFSLTWIISLTKPLFELFAIEVSWRDIVLVLGGLFLLVKGTMEIHHTMEGEKDEPGRARKAAVFMSVIGQILLLDLVFSVDSVLTAIGMADHLSIMVTAVVIAIIVMVVAAEPVSAFIQRHPTVKMLALAFLLLIGVALIADGAHFHIPRGYLYFAIAFSCGVEILNLLAARRRRARREAEAG